MIAYVRGVLQDLEEEKAILDVNGIGYGIFMPTKDLNQLGPYGREVTVYTYLNVREDAIQLYGFLSKDDLSVFKLLINVSGVGPKVAIGVLSVLSADDLRFAVLSDDVKTISGAPGIGKKTAQKLILELKDKLHLEDAIAHTNERAASTEHVSSGARGEAIQALQALGYSGSEALKAINAVQNCDEYEVEELIRLALKQI